MDLGRPVRLVPVGRAIQELQPLDEIPPHRVQVGAVGVVVERLLEVVDDKSPAGKDEPVRPAPGGEPLAVGSVHGEAGKPLEPFRLGGHGAHHEGDGLGGAGVGDGAQEVGEPRVYVAVVDGVAELVEHGVHPVGVGPDVGQHPHVVWVLPADREAEGVLVLAGPAVQVAPGNHAPHVQAEAVVGPAGQLRQVAFPEVAVQVEPFVVRGLLEKGIPEVPGQDGLDAETLLEPLVEVVLEVPKRRVGGGLESGHDPVQLPGVDLLQGQGPVEVVGVPGFAGEPVAQAGELAHGALDLPAHGLGGLPRLAALRPVVRETEDVPDLVLPDLLAADDAPVVAVGGVCLRLELLDTVEGLPVALQRGERQVEHLDLAPQDVVFDGVPALVEVPDPLVLFPVGEEPVVLLAGADELRLRLPGAGGREIPPGLPHGELDRRDSFLEPGDERFYFGGGGQRAANGRRDRACRRARSPRARG